MSVGKEIARPGRRLDLDWLRIAAFGPLILYHVGLLYVPWPYHAKSRHAVPALEPLLLAINPWRLLLLFLISGVATRFMSAAVPPGQAGELSAAIPVAAFTAAHDCAFWDEIR